MTRPSAPRGTRDLFGNDVALFQRLERAAEEVFSAYGYSELRTPSFENAELFSRAMGETTDVVEKEMFAFEDRGGRRLALRPEGTAGVARAYVEHSWDQAGTVRKVWYKGPMFRAERPQAGRYREFTQIGGEYFGNAGPEADAETLFLMRAILERAGVKDSKFLVNSLGDEKCRPAYRAALTQYLTAKRDQLCENCQRRMEKNPLRVLDCKADGPKLTDAPLMVDHLCEECRSHHGKVSAHLAAASFPYEPAPRLVRGLDYYTRTAFEVTAPGLGSQDAVGGGGRYDRLVKYLGGPDVPAIGFAFGVDRLAMALAAHGVGAAPGRRIFVAQAGEVGAAALSLAQSLRAGAVEKNIALAVELGAAAKSLKAQFRAADGWNADTVVIVGEDELKKGTVTVKDLKNSQQSEIPLAEAALRLLAGATS